MRFKKWIGLVLGCILAGCALTQANAESGAAGMSGPRIALVIGNADYQGGLMPALENPASDAKLISASLQKAGFIVMEVRNADQKQMKRAIAAFAARLAESGPKTTGLFYFAGYGISVDGTNYLVPIGADIGRQADVYLEALALGLVLKQMSFAGNAINIAIVDSSQNNGLSRLSRISGEGLGTQDMQVGMFLSYSAAPGTVALDGSGANSPYAAALAQAILTPGADINAVFTSVRKKVLSQTDQKQVTWDASTLTDPFIFMPQK